MSVTASQVERIVREVIAQFQAEKQMAPALPERADTPAGCGCGCSSSPVPQAALVPQVAGSPVARPASCASATASSVAVSAAAATVKEQNKVLAISSRVVTLACVEGKLSGVQQVIVPRKAVITPAVKDLFRQAKITVSYRSVISSTKGNPSYGATLVAVAHANFDTSEVITHLRQHGFAVEPIAQAGLLAAVEQLTDQVRYGERRGLLFTGEPVVASCLANRTPGVRAAVVDSLAGVESAVTGLGANLLIINPHAKSSFEIQRLASTYCGIAELECPVDLRSRLQACV